MSKESYDWLNTMTLIGFTEARGSAWHYREALQGTEPNHYPQAIPVEDVTRRLFNFEVVERQVFVADEFGPEAFALVEGRKALVASDNGDVFGIFSEGYRGHDYNTWLLDGPAKLISASRGELGVGSAGLLKGRAVAWVSIEVPGTITTPEGVAFRPNLVACTSFDGSFASTYKRTVTNVVCENTLSAGLSEDGQVYRVKHSRHSDLRLGEARGALAMLVTIADEFKAEVAQLTAWKVTTREWDHFLDAYVPIPEIPAGKETFRATTLAANKQDTLRRLYYNDQRCAPWKGTAFGVLQTVNTYEHHEATAKGSSRPQRNSLRALSGATEMLDRVVVKVLEGVCN